MVGVGGGLVRGIADDYCNTVSKQLLLVCGNCRPSHRLFERNYGCNARHTESILRTRNHNRTNALSRFPSDKPARVERHENPVLLLSCNIHSEWCVSVPHFMRSNMNTTTLVLQHYNQSPRLSLHSAHPGAWECAWM